MKLFSNFKHIVAILFALLLIGCEELPVTDSIFEEDPGEWDPQISNLEVNMGNGNTGTIDWQANEFALESSWMLESHSYSGQFLETYTPNNTWSDWDLNSHANCCYAIMNNLDDGQYTFHVKSRIELLEQEEASTVDFEIDAISGPALRIYPLRQKVDVDDEISVYIYFEEVPEDSAVTGLDFDIVIDTGLEFITDSFNYGDLIANFLGTTIFPDPNYSDDGRTLSIVGVADSSGTGIYGTGSIATFRLRVIGSWGEYDINIEINDRTFQNIVGDTLTTFGIFNGSVYVRQ